MIRDLRARLEAEGEARQRVAEERRMLMSLLTDESRRPVVAALVQMKFNDARLANRSTMVWTACAACSTAVLNLAS